MIKKLAYSLIFIAHALGAQNSSPVAVGNWRLHLNYQNVKQIAEVQNRIFCASSNGLFVYNGDVGSTERLSPINGFSGYDVDVLHYAESENTLIICYSNGTMDLLKDNALTMNEDIKRKGLIGSIKVNHINSNGEVAWFSTDFGLLEYNIRKNEFSNSYQYIGPNGTQIEVYSSAILNDSVFISTKFGVMKASLKVNLNNFTQWSVSKPAAIRSTFIAAYNNHLTTEIDSQLFIYKNGSWSLYENDSNLIIQNISVQHNKMIIGVYGKYVIKEDMSGSKSYINLNIMNQCMLDANDALWYASPNNGLVLYDPYATYCPNGPRSTDNFSFINAYDKLFVSAGSFSATTFTPSFNAHRFYYFDNFKWENSEINSLTDTLYDYTYMAFNKSKGQLFIATHTKGLLQLDNGHPTKVYDNGNSPLRKNQGIFCTISGLAEDKDNNLWVSNYNVDSALLQLSNSGKWSAYSLPVTKAGPITIDENQNKWIITPRTGSNTGIVYFNDKGTTAKTDDLAVAITTNKNNGNLPSAYITALAFTKDGELLVGSDQGYGRIRNPGNIENGGNFDFERIIVSVEAGTNLGGYLLGSEFVNCITLDGGDRRWVGTNNGAWLIDKDGETILHHFTMENSPLISNNVNCIGISESTGEVFFGTDKGIISFRSNASAESKDFSNIKIFPNPVRPDFDGDIAITGLQDNTLVKITDINGRLVYQTYSNGGMATWNCRTFDNSRPATGVYLAFCVNSDGSQTGMGKILFIR